VIVLGPRPLARSQIQRDVGLRVALLDRADREVAVGARVEGAVVEQAVRVVDELAQRRPVVVVGRSGQRGGKLTSELLGVDLARGGEVDVVAVDGPRIGSAGGDRRLVRLVDELVVGVPRIGSAEAAARDLVTRASRKKRPSARSKPSLCELRVASGSLM